MRDEIFYKSLVIKILAENINNHESLKSNNSLYNDFTYRNNNIKSKSWNNNFSNTPDMNFNIRKNVVEDKDPRSYKPIL